MQNLGTRVEPAWNARFRATIKVTSDTFTPDGTASGVTFVRPIKRDGETTEMFGKSVSRLYAGTWRTSFELDGQPIQALGMPESAFAPNKVIVRGSKSEADYIVEQSERRRQAQAAAQREAEERRAAQERANEEKRRMLANAPKLLIGTWRNQSSLNTYFADGTTLVKWDNGNIVKEKWSMDGDILTRKTFEQNGRPDQGDWRDRILEITQSKIVGESLSSGGKWKAERVK